jgi:hypothetical protein
MEDLKKKKGFGPSRRQIYPMRIPDHNPGSDVAATPGSENLGENRTWATANVIGSHLGRFHPTTL